MKIVKIIFALIAGVLILLGFAGWRLDFNLPLFAFWIYIVTGVVLGLALFYGRLIGRFLIIVSLLPFLYSLVFFLFDKTITWNDIASPMLYGAVSLVGGIILYAIGSERVESGHDASIAHSQRDIACASCEQYLGKAGSFTSPCPRCGSNRWKYDS